MIVIELLNNPPASFISAYCCSKRHEFRSHFQCTTSYCTYINWGVKRNTTCAKKNINRELVANRRFPKTRLANKVARIEFEPAFTEVTVPILKEKEENSENLDTNEIEADIYYLEERDEVILSERLLKLSRSNKVRSALALYKSMELSNLLPEPHACNSLLTCVLRNGKLEDALKIFEFMKSSEVITSHTYSLLLKAIAKIRSSDEAVKIFEEAQRDKKTKKYIDAIVYNTMISIYGKLNNWVQAERIWRILQDNHVTGTIVTYRLLVCIFVRCGQNELALDAYNEMLQNVLSPSEDSMQAIVGACTREGKWDLALCVMRNMLSREIKPSLVTCNALINSLGKASKVELAFEVYGLVKSLGYKPDAYTWNALIGALNRANRHGDALCLFERIREENGDVLNLHTYNSCLVSCQRLGLWERALQLLWRMEGLGFPVSVTSYNLAIGACEAARKPKVAMQIYDHMVRRKQSPDVFTPLSLIRVCIWGSLWVEVEEILNSAPNGSLYNAAIQGMCLRNKTELARKLYMKMREIGLKPDGKTRALMLQNLHRK